MGALLDIHAIGDEVADLCLFGAEREIEVGLCIRGGHGQFRERVLDDFEVATFHGGADGAESLE